MTTIEAPTAVQVGDVLAASFGYDQTNVHFYQVVGVTPTGKSVRLRRIAAEYVDATGGPVEYVRPVVDGFLDEKVVTHRYRADGGYAKIRDHIWAFKVDPEATHYVTGGGWGH